jgi:hypothetical protein
LPAAETQLIGVKGGQRSEATLARFPILGGNRVVSTATLSYDLPTGRTLTIAIGDRSDEEKLHHEKKVTQFSSWAQPLVAGDVNGCKFSAWVFDRGSTKEVTAIFLFERVRVSLTHVRATDVTKELWEGLSQRLAQRVSELYDKIITAPLG